jgi:hypothetical protein
MWLLELIVPSDYKEPPMSFIKQPPSFPPIPTPFAQNDFLKTFQWSRHYSKVFEIILKIFFECSHPRVFGSTRSFPKALMITIKPYYRGVG